MKKLLNQFSTARNQLSKLISFFLFFSAVYERERERERERVITGYFVCLSETIVFVAFIFWSSLCPVPVSTGLIKIWLTN